MTTLDDQLLEAMSSKPPDQIRNICLIAHVDHGKTSYADSLVSSNAIISARMAGKLRYLDSREDEQTRGITMKSSGISLLCEPLLINLIDSPGHVDFSGEVTSALLLSDVALLLVDIIEGICSQTEALLRQAITNGQTIILVINKLDRLRIEFKMNAQEAYTFIQRLIEAVNSCVSQIITGLILEDDSWGNIEKVEEEMHFDPAKGNVIFSSAVHAYAFSMDDFAEIYAPKLNLNKSELAKSLFGDFFLHGGKITPDAVSKGKKTLFEQLVLEPLWMLHDCGLVNEDLGKLTELAGKLGLKIKSRRVNEAFDEMMRVWLPLPKATFRAIARAPSARTAFQRHHRIEHLVGKRESHPLKEAILSCSPDKMTLLFVAKFIRVDEKKLAIVRMLSGKIKQGDELHILGKKQRNSDENAESSLPKTTIKGVFVLRGREANRLTGGATAGVICAIEADGLILNCTLCSEPCSEGLNLGRELGEPLVRVSVSTKELERLGELKEALKNLVVLDPSLRVLELETGELAMVTAGEVHLQKCLKDLEDLGFEDLEVSSPIVPFLETLVPDSSLTQQQIQDQITECRTKGDALVIRLRIVPLPIEIVNLLEKNTETLRNQRKNQHDDESWIEFKSKLQTACTENLPKMKGSWWYKKSKEEINELIERIWSFGPDRARSTILFNGMPSYQRKSIWTKSGEGEFRLFDQAIVAGFELFANAGPLCNEVMRGVGVIVEEWTVANENDSTIGGQLMSAMKATCTAAAGKLALRLVAAMYKCTVATSSQALGKCHAVLAQRKAKVLSEDINEATGLFEVVALLPVVESFAFCEQLRKSTSGLASAQLHFSHWQIIDEDPYWTPSTLEEIEEFGMKGDSPNHARGYMDAVRRRKGLPTQDLIVISAEKQRNLKKNK